MADWIDVLGAECAHASQAKLAKRLGVSAAMINQVLRGRYTGNTANLEQRVRGELMRETVICPVLGETSKRDCLDAQSRPFAATNPQRVQLFTACKTCPNRRNP